MKKGMVYLIGAGPGDPGLITAKGLRALSLCDAVVYDHLAGPGLLEEAREGCERFYVGKRAGHHSIKQEEINGLLIRLAGEGKRVARLKGGDPYVFGRGGEEALALRAAGIAYQVVPGVSSAVAAAACAGIPVTHRALSRSFHVITGHAREGEEAALPDFDKLAALSGTLVFLMGLGRLPAIAKGMIEAGKPEDLPAAVIENGSLPGQRAVRGCLGNIAERVREAGLGTPAVIVIGETAAMDLSCASLPLRGARIGVVGTRAFGDKLSAALEALGGTVQTAGVMETCSFGESALWRERYRSLKDYTCLVFTSANGVRLFFDGLLKAGQDFRAVGHLSMAVVGPGTGEALRRLGFKADFMPQEYTTRALGELLAKRLGRGERLLLARSAEGSPQLGQALSEAGLWYEDGELYQVRERDFMDIQGLSGLDYLAFGSASGVEAFWEAHRGEAAGLFERTRPAAIGRVTAEALKRRGILPAVTAGAFTAEGLAEAVAEDWERSRRGQERAVFSPLFK